MKKLLFSIAALLCVSAAWADDGFVVSNIEIPQNGTVELEVGLNNSDNECAGFQFQLYLPEGISVTQENEEYLFTDGSRLSGKNFTTQLSWDTDHYQILSYSGTVKTMTGTSGTIISIPLEVTGSFTVAQELNASLKVCKMTNKEEQSITLNDEIPFTITIGEPDDGRTVLDETSTTAPTAAEGVDVRVLRTIKANEWSTICLPFAMTAEQVTAAFGDDVQLGNFKGYVFDSDNAKITINFEDTTGIKANHPQIIKVTSSVSEFTVDGVTIAPEDNPCVSYGSTTGSGKNKVYHPSDFKGTYVADFDFYGDATSYPLFLSGSKFYYATENTTMHMKAYRAYFDLDDYLEEAEPDPSRIIMSFDDSKTTGILAVDKKNNDKVYNLSGQQVKNPAKGIYVKDGKKVIIK